MHAPAVPEPDFVLGRVCIRIHQRGIHAEAQHIGRKPALEKNVAVGMSGGVPECLVGNTAAIDEPELKIRLAAIECRQSKPS